MEKLRILVYGGSFDPPHPFHIRLLKQACKEIKPNRVFIVVSYISPFKQSHFASYIHRKRMLKILFKKNKLNARFLDFEFRKKRKTYTYELGRYLKKRFPQAELFFLMGSDCFNSLKRWKRYTEVIKNFIIVAGKRKGYEIEHNNFCGKIIVLKKEFNNVSSTGIRENIFTGNFSVLDKDIEKYIKKEKLYFSDVIEFLKKNLSYKRFTHTINVTKLAIRLAKRYGVDLKKTVLAALLHDVAKELDIPRQLELIKKSKLKVEKIKKILNYATSVLHQYSSAAFAILKFKIKDTEIISAIKNHATGNKNPSLLSKIIYVSDFSSVDRAFKEARVIRKLAFENINLAYEKAKKIKIEYIRKAGGIVL